MNRVDYDPATTMPGPGRPPDGYTGAAARERGRLGRLFLGPAGAPRWARPALWVLLATTAVLYVWDLSGSGYANDFYAAAVKSGTESWKAWLFGSLDSSNAITVDKPPASLWLMVLSARLFGFSSLAVLLPQALLGVGTVAITWAAVRRWSGEAAGLLAGTLVTLTPVAALMFRFNNPDALLVFLMTLAGYFVVRAIETRRGRTALRWLIVAGVAIGLAFLTKMMQGLIVLPALGLAYLVAGRSGWWTRVWHLLAAGVAVIISAGWFVLLVALWPTDSRPYIGGSQNNSLWELAIGYNGLSRIFGNSGGAAGGSAAAPGGAGGGNTGFGGAAGVLRMFGTAFGSEISWLLPAALIGLVAGLWLSRRAERTDRIRANLIVWGGSLVVTMAVFSFMEGTIHPYYAVALAPPIAAVVAISGRELWHGRAGLAARSVLAAMIAVTGTWSFVLLDRDSSWLPWLRWIVLIGSIAGALLLVVSFARMRRLATVGLLVGMVTALGGTTAYTVATAATPHSGSIPASGPAGSGTGGFGGVGRTGFGEQAGFGGQAADGRRIGGTGSNGEAAGVPGAGGQAAVPESDGQPPNGGGTTSSELTAILDATETRWSAAVLGSQMAAAYILSTDTAVMAIGGWSNDPSPTLAQFQQYVADGDIGYFIAGGQGSGRVGGPGGGSSTSSQIQQWVEANFTAMTVGGVTVYDLASSSTA